jgi:1-acyl-sn-glycerol-3-phosphate acyltransferase
MLYYFKLLLIVLWFLVLFIIWIPLCLIRFRDPDVLNSFFTVFSGFARRLLNIEVRLQGLNKEAVEKYQPCVFVANEQSALELILLPVLGYQHFVAVGKIELLNIPVFGLLYWLTGHVLIKRGEAESLAVMTRLSTEINEKNRSIGIYPEGTRNRQWGTFLSFRKGAFMLAIEAQVPVIPVVFSSLEKVFEPNTRKVRGGVIHIRTLPAIATTTMTAGDIDALSNQVREEMLAAFYEMSSSAQQTN